MRKNVVGKIMEYTKITNFTGDNVDMEEIYQVQNESGKIKIQKVGEYNRVPNILINQFNFKKFQCYILSVLYDKSGLDQAIDNGLLTMVKLQLHLDGVPVACAMYNFKKSNRGTDNLDGCYCSTFHFDEDKYFEIGVSDDCSDDIIGDLIKNLYDDRVLDLLDSF